MVKQVCLEIGVKDLIDELGDTESWEIGIFVGYCTESKDYIVHFAKTPLESLDRVKGLSGLSDVAVSSHVIELSRMLTGGLSICGIGVVACQADLDAANIKMHQIMQSCYKKVEESSGPQTSDIWHFISTDSRTSKLSAKQLEMKDYKSIMQKSELKTQSLKNGWLSVESSLPVNQTFFIARHDEDKDFEMQILSGLSPLKDSVNDAVYIVNGDLLNDDTEFGVRNTKNNKKSDHPWPAVEKLDVQLLAKPPHAQKNLCEDGVARIRISGSVTSRSFLRAPAKASNLRQAVSSDLRRSTELHTKLLCEDILQVGSEKHNQEPELIYETPLRVYITLDNRLPICFSDFIFRDEKVEDCIERASQILGIPADSITASDVDVSSECTATEKDIEDVRSTGCDLEEEVEIVESSAGNSSIRQIAAMASAAVLGLAVSFTYLNTEGWFS